MTAPVTLSSGITYEKQEILAYLEKYKEDPVTRKEIKSKVLIPNRHLKRLIDKFNERTPADSLFTQDDFESPIDFEPVKEMYLTSSGQSYTKNELETYCRKTSVGEKAEKTYQCAITRENITLFIPNITLGIATLWYEDKDNYLANILSKNNDIQKDNKQLLAEKLNAPSFSSKNCQPTYDYVSNHPLYSTFYRFPSLLFLVKGQELVFFQCLKDLPAPKEQEENIQLTNANLVTIENDIQEALIMTDIKLKASKDNDQYHISHVKLYHQHDPPEEIFEILRNLGVIKDNNSNNYNYQHTERVDDTDFYVIELTSSQIKQLYCMLIDEASFPRSETPQSTFSWALSFLGFRGEADQQKTIRGDLNHDEQNENIINSIKGKLAI